MQQEVTRKGGHFQISVCILLPLCYFLHSILSHLTRLVLYMFDCYGWCGFGKQNWWLDVKNLATSAVCH
jgi:hypothetical protein